MAKDEELVKVVAKGGASVKTAAVTGAVGVATGAGAAIAALKKRHHGDAIDLTEHSSNGIPGKEQVTAFDRDAAGVDSPKKERGIKGKLLRAGERRGWGWLGRTMQVMRRYSELRGSNIAAAVTLQIFLSIFPLFLVVAAVVGFVAGDDPREVGESIVNSLGLTGDAAITMQEAVGQAVQSREASSVLGLATLLWSALGVTSALQYAYNQAWQSGGRGVKDKAVGIVWLAGAGFLFGAAAVLTTLLNFLPAGLGALGIVASIAVTFALWMFTGKALPNVDVPWKALIPGAILGVIGLEALKLAGGLWVPRAVESSSELYGAVGVLLAVLAWMLLFGKLVMYSAVLNVVMYEAKHGTKQEVIEMPKASAKGNEDVMRSGSADK